MKNTFFTVLVILALTMVATTSKATDTNTMFNDYEITDFEYFKNQTGIEGTASFSIGSIPYKEKNNQPPQECK